MSVKKYGLNYERKRKKQLEKEGKTAMRCRGSFGLFDILWCDGCHWGLEQIKSTKQKYYSYKKELDEIKKFKNAPNGTLKRVVLFHKGKMKILYEEMII